jgi:hypothetical protein
MSSSGQSKSPDSNFPAIIDALAEYANQTGINLSQNPFADRIRQSNTPGAILELLQEREKAFKEYRDGNPRLINCLSSIVGVLHAFSGTLGEVVTLVSHTVRCAFMDHGYNVISSGTLPACKSCLCRY